MSLWGQLFALGYDRVMAGAEAAGLSDRRRRLLADAHGDVLEIGGGTGVNLPFYPDAVRSLTVVEPEAPMAKRLEPRLRERFPDGRLVAASAERLPFPDGSFDVAVATLVLCTIVDQAAALSELRRVLRPSGRLLFIEHVRSDDPRLARWQDRWNPMQKRIAHGCNCNRTTLAGIEAAGFTLTDVERGSLPKAPKLQAPMVIGIAAPPDPEFTPPSVLSRRTSSARARGIRRRREDDGGRRARRA
jgi:SAM-dependent methyltransferase